MEQIAIAPAPQPKVAPQAANQKKGASSSQSEKQDFKTAFDNSIREKNQTPDKSPSQTAEKQQATGQQDNVTKEPQSNDKPAKDQVAVEESTPNEQLSSADQQDQLSSEISDSNIQPDLPPGLSALLEKFNITLTGEEGALTSTEKTSSDSPFAKIPQQLLELLINKRGQQLQTQAAAGKAGQQIPGNNILNQDPKIVEMAKQLDAIISNFQQKGTASVTIERVAEQASVTINPSAKPAIAGIENIAAQVIATGTDQNKVSLLDTNDKLSRVAQMRQDAILAGNNHQSARPVLQTEQNNTSQQNTGDNTQSASSQVTSTMLNSTTGSSEQQTSFAQTLNTQATTASQTVAATKSAPQTFGQPQVNENNVMQQVIQRFNVNPRLQTSKISMQLNPAELGEVKLDILVKGDNIKASIVTPNPQVQDIIEKNMARLRTVLQEQGFTIDDIVVSSTNEDGSSFNLFQESFSQQRQQQRNDSSSVDFEIPIDEIANATEIDQSGINVKI